MGVFISLSGLVYIYRRIRNAVIWAVTKSVKVLLDKNSIHISLWCSEESDLSVRLYVQSVVENREFFETLFTVHPLKEVKNPENLYYFLLARKISVMQKLEFENSNVSESLKSIADIAHVIYRSSKGKAIGYLKDHKEEIFSDSQHDNELKYAALDFIIECRTGIDYSVFDYLCRHCFDLVISRFHELNCVFQKYKDLFKVLFSHDINFIKSPHLRIVLDILKQEYKKKDTTGIREQIDRCAAKLCRDAEPLYLTISEDNAIEREPGIRYVASFLSDIKNPRADEFFEYVKREEQQYFLKRCMSVRFTVNVPGVQSWKPLNDNLKLLVLTHHRIKSAHDPQKYESYLNEKLKFTILDCCCTDSMGSTVSTAAGKFSTAGFENQLELIAKCRAASFLDILNNLPALNDYSELVRSAVSHIFVRLSQPDCGLREDTELLLSMLISVNSHINEKSIEQESACYTASMFICSITEKLLRLFYRHFYRHLEKGKLDVQYEITLGDLLNPDNKELSGAFGSDHLRCLGYFLIMIKVPETDPEKFIGINLRNNLAHWSDEMKPEAMDPGLTSTILWLFTDVLNSILLYFDGQAAAGDSQGHAGDGSRFFDSL